VSIHGGKEQSDRNEAIQLFKDGKKDVLIATDIAAKVCVCAYISY
jgi:ATP-dependent RNA helicase DDX41